MMAGDKVEDMVSKKEGPGRTSRRRKDAAGEALERAAVVSAKYEKKQEVLEKLQPPPTAVRRVLQLAEQPADAGEAAGKSGSAIPEEPPAAALAGSPAAAEGAGRWCPCRGSRRYSPGCSRTPNGGCLRG